MGEIFVSSRKGPCPQEVSGRQAFCTYTVQSWKIEQENKEIHNFESCAFNTHCFYQEIKQLKPCRKSARVSASIKLPCAILQF